jgi:hypothetical protein
MDLVGRDERQPGWPEVMAEMPRICSKQASVVFPAEATAQKKAKQG